MGSQLQHMTLYLSQKIKEPEGVGNRDNSSASSGDKIETWSVPRSFGRVTTALHDTSRPPGSQNLGRIPTRFHSPIGKSIEELKPSCFADTPIVEGVSVPMSEWLPDGEGSDPQRVTSGPESGRRPALSTRRPQPSSTSARHPRPRQPVQAPAQPYHSTASQETVSTTPNSYGGFQGHIPAFQPNVSPYDPGTNYGVPYTMPPNSSMTMAHAPAVQRNHTFSHGVHSPIEASAPPPNTHAGFSSMVPLPGYSYQRHSPESVSSSHSFPNYQLPHMTPFPPPTASSSAGPPHSSSYMQPGQYPPPYTSGTPYSTYHPSQPFVSSTPVYQGQYTQAPYPPNFVPSSTPDGLGAWWYMPPGSTAQAHQYDAAHTSYPHYPMTYIRGDASYPMDNPAQFSTNPAYSGHQPVSGLPPARSEPPVPSSSSAPYARSSPQSAPAVEPILAQPVPSKAPETRTAIRRSYHPNPPVQRSEWVMWAGNIPSDTVHDELWRFFKQPPSQSSTRAPSPEKGSASEEAEELYDGVTSIFLISRSNCAFVNFETEAHLHKAIDRFNGVPLRPNDTRCPRLLCRVRKKDDDLKAGVGGQRGMGIHTRWVKEREAKPEEPGTSTPAAPLEQLTSAVGSVSLSSDEEPSVQSPKQSSTGSYASTNSSILTRHFPKRYFILKSLTQYDLDLSVEKRLWATQKHNEGILDQAYRTSTDVYLVFSVNKSGEFYGYARMNGPILEGGHSVSWASRTSEANASARSSLSSTTGRAARRPDGTNPIVSGHRVESPNFFSPVEDRLVEQSPAHLSESERQETRLASARVAPSSASNQVLHSAPAVLGTSHRKLTADSPKPKQSLGTDQLLNAPVSTTSAASLDLSFELDPKAPERARRDTGSTAEPSSLPGVPEELDTDVTRADDAAPTREGWGASFPIEWICVDRLPFFRTRHLRNPWNHDREIKVSRDGTELEPAIGQTLLDEWKTLAAQTTVDDEKPPRKGPGTPTATAMSTALEPRTKGGTRRS